MLHIPFQHGPHLPRMRNWNKLDAPLRERILELSKNKSQHKSRRKETGKERIAEQKKHLHCNRLSLEQPKKPLLPALQKLLPTPKKKLQSCTPACLQCLQLKLHNFNSTACCYLIPSIDWTRSSLHTSILTATVRVTVHIHEQGLLFTEMPNESGRGDKPRPIQW